jgi:hypothetical protein
LRIAASAARLIGFGALRAPTRALVAARSARACRRSGSSTSRAGRGSGRSRGCTGRASAALAPRTLLALRGALPAAAAAGALVVAALGPGFAGRLAG